LGAAPVRAAHNKAGKRQQLTLEESKKKPAASASAERHENFFWVATRSVS